VRSPVIGPTLVLLGATAFFLWMFLAVAPVETLADTGGLAETDRTDAVAEAYRFAADWRHGMAGNSPLYMPGFFALAVATWLWSGSRGRDIWRLVAEGGAILSLGLIVAWACAGVARGEILQALERSSGLTLAAPWPEASGRAVIQGLYTAVTWMASVAACRRALERRTLTPLLVIPPITIVLALIRPWTVDDFAALWTARVRAGSVAAIGSLVAIPLIAVVLLRATPRRQWVQTQRNDRRIGGDV
jgi:hypothetical protein